jgi:hypothetical protein
LSCRDIDNNHNVWKIFNSVSHLNWYDLRVNFFVTGKVHVFVPFYLGIIAFLTHITLQSHGTAPKSRTLMRTTVSNSVCKEVTIAKAKKVAVFWGFSGEKEQRRCLKNLFSNIFFRKSMKCTHNQFIWDASFF